MALRCHRKAVNAIHWSRVMFANYSSVGSQSINLIHYISHLLASAGMDGTICIWNVWSVLSFHNAAVKNVKWSQQGHFVLSCGYDHSLRLTDVEKSIGTQNFKEEYVVRVMKFHPDNSNLFLAGGVLSDCGIY
ncbi:hypothetical protein Ddye_027128 [Dipteronia dyeriana]|uniref:Uncharacterized protein n=1 Tax=Dipteronia dyeriana TaxID=168575 RepID=A0AAD9WR32_9ROSI|nr:hypothetical protein Ddye_027127 [Dipteronia dyeriana]KAK2639333.1 hypothetical protein Ddye_027128 [Dipteronia dyeriana]